MLRGLVNESDVIDRLCVYDDKDEYEKTEWKNRSESATQTRKTAKCPSDAVKYSKTVTLVKHITPNHKPKKRKIRIMNWKKYHRLDVIYSFLEELERDYPAICTVSVIGKSVEGREIKMLKISNSAASNTGVWLDASIHSREWITTAVITYLTEILVTNFRKLPVYLTNKDWHIVPVLNPDGYEYTHTHDRMWRKNRATYGENCVGVDLNRNFSYGWGNNGEEGSSEEFESPFYRGPAPFSEPEAVAVRDTILGANIPFKVFISFHSYYELIIFPWGHKKDPCPDYVRLLEGGTAMARAIFERTGYTYKVGSTKDLTYYACGTSTDWSYGVANIPYSYMIELRGKKNKFRLPKDQIIDNCVEIWCAVRSLMVYVDKNSVNCSK